ncbi:MAG: NFACT RNA binding domain-containing protein [Chloroflexota bacterium]|nr:NFACT RNA binding domain-containing protein [Chloroflexota bacterium]
MYFDAMTTAAVVDELQETIVGGRVQAVLQPDEWSVGLEVYAHRQRRYLLLSAHPDYARVHLVREKLRRGVEGASPLLLLLRKNVRGGQVLAVAQPPFERILHVRIAHREGETTLIAEVMGRYANLALVAADGIVMGCLKSIGPEMSRVRTLLPNRLYVPPPPQPKLDPTDLDEARARHLLATARDGTPLWRVLVNGVRGVSPLLAREVAFRATGEVSAPVGRAVDAALVVDSFQDLMMLMWEHRWRPSLAYEQGEPLAFAPYLLTQYARIEELSSIGEILETYYVALLGEDAYAAAKDKARVVLEEARRRVERKRQALLRAQPTSAEIEALRHQGELILAYAHTLQPGQQELTAQMSPQESPLTIRLNPKLSAVENAQAYFKEYRKAKSAAEGAPARLAQTDLELRYLDQLAADLELAANRPEIEEVRAALMSAGYLQPERAEYRPQHSRLLETRSADGFTILVGKNARQNELLTFRRAAPDDLWLHAQGVPGAHVIVKTGGRPVPETTLRQAARLAAQYSAARQEKSVAVDYTLRRYVKRVRGGRPGMATYRHERTLTVSLASGQR